MKLSNFKKYAGPVITRRAAGYLAEGRVHLVAETDGEYEYLVHGTQDYSVWISTDGDEILDTSCNCPYSGMCKHVTAALMDIKERQLEEKNQPDVTENLEPAAKEQRNGLGLTEDEMFVLSYMAFTGMAGYNRCLQRLPSAFAPLTGYNQTRYEAIKKSLRKEKWLREQGNVGAVSPAKIMLVLIALVRSHRDWLTYFERWFKQADYVLYLTDVAKVIAGEKVPQVHYYRFGYHYYGDAQDYVKQALLGAISAATPEQMGAFMDDNLLCEMANVLLNRVLELGYVGELDYVDALFSQLKHANATSASLYCRYRLATFYALGTELPSRPSSDNYHETFYLAAAKALLGGDAAEAISLFQQGLKIQNKKSDAKNIPDDNVSFFLYTVALSIRRNDKDVSALTTILKKRYDIRQHEHFFVFPLVAFSQSTDQRKDNSFIDSAKVYYPDGRAVTSNVIAALTACFFGMKEKWKQPFPDAKMLILRAECERYFPEALSEPIGQWPYEAVLPRIPVRQAWELQIEELLRQVHQAAPATPVETRQQDEKRLYYLADSYYSRRVEVREQWRLASGAWSKGKKLSLLRYKTGECPMDEVDRKIYAEWLKGDPAYERHYAQSELPSLELVLPYLVGTDKLMTEYRGDILVVEVKVEKPFLWTQKSGGEIHFGSNIPLEDCKEYSSMYAYYPSPEKIVLYPMPAEVIPAYKRILEIRHLPEEAEPMLGKLFEALRGRLEVHSDIYGGVSLPKVDGSSQIIVKVTPTGECFYLSALVRPLEGGRAEYLPGKGDSLIYDSRDGERVEVVRDLKRELSNFRKVNSLVPSDLRFSSDVLLGAMDFLEFMDRAAELPSVVALEWPEGEPLKLRKPDTSKWEINAVGKGGWYELEGELAVSDDKVLSVGELLSLLRSSEGRYVRLGEKEYMLLSEGIRRQLERVDYASQEYRGKLRIPELALAAMGDQLSGEVALDEPDAVLELRERIRRSRNAVYEVPSELNATLRYYQEEGFQWLMRVASWGAGACLADDMGLGKTVQAIAFMLAHASEGPSLVVAPASVVSNWQRELARFAPTLRGSVLMGLSSDSRGNVLNGLVGGDVLIVTYGLLASEAERLAEVKWNVACLDEAHTIKNRDTKTSAAAMMLEAAHRLILTGTPVQNHLGELWNLFRFINPGLLGTYEQFAEKYMVAGAGAEGGGGARASSSPSSPTMALKRLVSPFLLRRTKQEVVRELPDKEEIVVPVTLSDDETAVYEVIRREAVSQVTVGSALSVNALSMITKLRMAACAASLAEKNWVGGACSKIEAFLDLLMPIVEGGNSVLIFSQFTSFLTMAVAALEKAGISDYLYLDGKTQVSKRQKLVDSFQNGEHKVFFISLKAGGLGLNLTGANYVIHLDPWWNPAIEQQATDRAYRIGQSQKVTVYHLISSQTIEEKILRLHATKRSLADAILEGADSSSRLTPEELLEMLG